MKKIYLFDFDGTLADSAKYIAKTTYEYLDSRNLKYPDDVIKRIMPIGWRGFAEYARSLGATETVDQIVAGIEEGFKKVYFEDLEIKPYVKDYLMSLKAEGASLYILTGSPRFLIEPCLKRSGVYELFDHIWSVNDFDLKKTDPRIYELTVGQLGIPYDEICFFDDNYDVLKTAKALGFKIVGVYDKTSEEYAEDIKKISEKYIVSFDELL